MTLNISSLIEHWDGLAVVSRYDADTGTWIFICLHDDTLGPCTGGTRMKVYPSPADGLLDAMRLAEGMTSKWAAIDEAAGGGKAVLALARRVEGAERATLLRHYGRLIDFLRGSFRTGEDLGTSSEDMKVLAETTRYVHGFHPADGSKVDPSPFTARAVFSGIKSAVAEVFGSEDLAGRAVLVEGVGHVGSHLARSLSEAGARVLISDIDAERARTVGEALDAEVVPAESAVAAVCDVYAPCAVGATLNRDSIPRLGCRIVAGSANNQLAEPEDAQRLLERGIVYVPDYIINAGGALSFALLDRGIGDHRELLSRMDAIGESVCQVLQEAAARRESPLAAARRRVEKTLKRARASRLQVT